MLKERGKNEVERRDNTTRQMKERNFKPLKPLHPQQLGQQHNIWICGEEGSFSRDLSRGRRDWLTVSHIDEKLGSPIGHLRVAVILNAVDGLVSLKRVT